MVSYVIPVYNQSATIRDAVESAAACADAIGGEVIVAVNCCEDDTLAIVTSLAAGRSRIRVLPSPDYLSAADNLARGLAAAVNGFVVMLGGDDTVPTDGQIALGRRVQQDAGDHPEVYFGEMTIIHPAGISRNATSQWYRWHNCTRVQAEHNVLAGRYPNINGTWIPRDLFISATAYANDVMGEEYVSYAGDAAVWWYLCQRTQFVYCPCVSINYRVYSVQSKSLYYTKGSRRIRPHMGMVRLFSHVCGDVAAADEQRDRWRNAISAAVTGYLYESSGFDAADKRMLYEASARLPLKEHAARLLRVAQRWPRLFKLMAAIRRAGVRLRQAAMRPIRWCLSPVRPTVVL